MGVERIWLPEILERVAGFMEGNDVACNLRMVNKVAARALRRVQHTTIRLSQPAPHAAFTRRWQPPGAVSCMTLRQRQQLLSLTASSGIIANLEVAVAVAGCFLTAVVMAAAAAAGHTHVCRWLLKRGCPWGNALAAAARAGRREACEWLLGNGCHWDECAVREAQRGGHPELSQWLRNQPQAAEIVIFSAPLDPLLCAAEWGDLAELQRLHAAAFGNGAAAAAASAVVAAARPDARTASQLLAAAAASPTPDWRAKVEWLEGREGAPPPRDCQNVFFRAVLAPATPDRNSTRHHPHSHHHHHHHHHHNRDHYHHTHGAGSESLLSRLRWLRQRGYPLPDDAIWAAGRAGDMELLAFLLAEGARPGPEAALAAASFGHLAVLSALRAAGCPLDSLDLLHAAASGGHLAVVQYVWDVLALGDGGGGGEGGGGGRGGGRRGGAGGGGPRSVLTHAACSGRVEVLAWLAERGCAADGATFLEAAVAGCEEALEWLAARGVGPGDDGEPYVSAARNGDLATLRCLRRLGCPWGPEGRVFALCGYYVGRSWAPLQWLLQAGCPVDGAAAARHAESWPEEERVQLMRLLEEREDEQQERGRGREQGQGQEGGR
ncbi:hypothetical protein GPECTOR_54g220 [Gonium pectorale]|uniref:Uncharacterized protein n=1 Tax=Gonium pectorale TaxID=33097 RepID=A0A150G6I9_GONPE|nr:hypothetical protein GPECTOR_54g220 [Gonium pectorale]|eukprot:KXZ45479.1 hypothetical protein GPECTOR_54g220 [Gonium pectorale]